MGDIAARGGLGLRFAATGRRLADLIRLLPSEPAATQSHGMFAPLAVRDFRLLFLGLLIAHALSPFQFVAQIIWVQASAEADLRIVLVGLIAAVRGGGMLLFGLYGGALADRFDRRKLLIVTQLAALAFNIAIGVLMIVGDAQGTNLVVFYGLVFISSALASIDAPTRQAIVPDILGRERTTAGIALNAAGGQVALPVALVGTGFVIDAFGPGVGYLVGAFGHLAEVLALLLMRHRTERRHHATAFSLGAALQDIREGLAYTRAEPRILWVVVLLVTMMGLGFPAVANLGPTWITTVVGVPVRDFGLVAATWGIGALLASGLMARFSRYERKGRIVALSTVGFGLSFLVFGGGHTVANAVIGNFGLGIAMATSQIAGTALIQLVAPANLRGRVMSVLNLNMGIAQIVTLPLAALGQWVTLQALFPILAFALLAVAVAILLLRPVVWRSEVSA